MDPRADLADAIRALIAASVRNDAPSELLADVAAAVRAQTDRLADHRLPARPQTTGDFRMPYDAVIGAYNAVAPPVAVELTGDKAVGRATFTEAYEGPPDCVQGGVIAACFDIVLSGATFIHDAAGPTISLTLRYRKPTRLFVESVFECQLDRREGVRTFATGRLLQGDVVTVEAEAVFANIGRDRTLRLGR